MNGNFSIYISIGYIVGNKVLRGEYHRDFYPAGRVFPWHGYIKVEMFNLLIRRDFDGLLNNHAINIA
jgi:hypothetical protein